MDIYNILYYSIFYAFINQIFNFMITGRKINASLFFWFSWIFLLTGTISFINNGLMREFSFYELDTISTFLNFCFFGFLAGSFFSIFLIKNRYYENDTIMYNYSSFIIENYFYKILYTVFFIGLIFLTIRIFTIGYVGLDFFTQSRNIYNERNFSLLQWVGTHLSILVYFMLILHGYLDSKTNYNIKKIILVTLLLSPLFLANSTRTFIISPILHYTSAFVIARSFRNEKIFNFSELFRIMTLVVILLIVFSLIGFTRGGYGDTFNFYLPIIGWPVSTAEEFTNWLNITKYYSTEGYITLGWFADISNRFGIADFSNEKQVINEINKFFVAQNMSAVYVPRSVIIDLILDFGYQKLGLSSLILTFFTQIIVNIKSYNPIFFVTVVVLFIACGMTIQNSYFSPGTIALIFWSIFSYIYFKLSYGDTKKFH